MSDNPDYHFEPEQEARAFEDAARVVVAQGLGMLLDDADVTKVYDGGFDRSDALTAELAPAYVHAHFNLATPVDTGEFSELEMDETEKRAAERAKRIVPLHLRTIANVAAALLVRGGMLSR